LQLKITLLKNRETIYEKALVVTMAPVSYRNDIELQKRAYEMIDLTISKILDNPGFRENVLK